MILKMMIKSEEFYLEDILYEVALVISAETYLKRLYCFSRGEKGRKKYIYEKAKLTFRINFNIIKNMFMIKNVFQRIFI